MITYRFDAVPSSARSDRRLRPIDLATLAILISFDVRRMGSSWASISTLAGRLPGRGGTNSASDRTAQRSVGRLVKAGYLDHRRVACPDPDDERNLLGWRFFFSFAVPTMTPDTVVTQDKPEVFEPEKNDRQTREVVVPQVPVREVQEPTADRLQDCRTIDPTIAELIAQVIPDETTRLDLAAHVSQWVGLFTVARIILAIKEGAERRKRAKVHNLAGYVGRILSNWQAEGKASPRLAKGSTSAPISTEASKAQYEAKREAEKEKERQLAASRASQEASLEARWQALAQTEREAIEAEVDRENPRPGRLSTATWGAIRRALCLDRLGRFAERPIMPIMLFHDVL
jgi:hypothetical protein